MPLPLPLLLVRRALCCRYTHLYFELGLLSALDIVQAAAVETMAGGKRPGPRGNVPWGYGHARLPLWSAVIWTAERAPCDCKPVCLFLDGRLEGRQGYVPTA